MHVHTHMHTHACTHMHKQIHTLTGTQLSCPVLSYCCHYNSHASQKNWQLEQFHVLHVWTVRPPKLLNHLLRVTHLMAPYM